jgi:transposase
VEASSLGLWLYRELQAKGLPIIVVEARHMRVSLSTMRNKTNRNDARGIAQMMRLGWFRAVHVKNVEMQKMRTLLTNRKLLKRKLVDIENHIRGTPRTCGLLVGAVSRGRYEARVRADRTHGYCLFDDDRDDAGCPPGDLRWLRQAESGASAGGSARSDLLAFDDRARCRPRCGTFKGRGRRSAALYPLANRWCVFWPEAQASSVGNLDRL